MFRILILFLLGLLIFRLGSVLLRGFSASSRKRRPASRQGGIQVGEGKIIKDEIDNPEKKKK